jgi:hypothetical protein
VKFTATVESAGGGGHRVDVPADVAASFDSKRPPVLAVINGIEYRSRLMVYGGRSYLGLRNDVLASLGADVGTVLDIELTLDEAPRVVEEPPELVSALSTEPAARARYDALSFTHRREYATWVGGAKRAETRLARADKAVSMLLAGMTVS